MLRKRFPRIPHVVNGPLKGGGVSRDDLVLTAADAERFLDPPASAASGGTQSNNVTWSVCEKVDGANTGISYCTRSGFQLQNRSHTATTQTGQYRCMEAWLATHGAEIIALLMELQENQQVLSVVKAAAAREQQLAADEKSRHVRGQKQQQQKSNDDDDDDHAEQDGVAADADSSTLLDWTVYGELVYHRHSVKYETLPDIFLVFDIYHAPTNQFLSVPLMLKLMAKFCPSLHTVPVLLLKTNERPSWDEIHASYHMKPSRFNAAVCCEGAVIRVDVDGVLLRRCKAVHDEFRQAINDDGGVHWTRKEVVKNGVVFGE
jgi:hypothetical protein